MQVATLVLIVAAAGCGRIGYDAATDAAGDAGDAGTDAAAACRFRDLAVGREHACAIDAAGDVWCWGLDRRGAASGTGGGPPVLVPRRPSLPRPAAELALAADATCARLDNDEVWCWGASAAGNGPSSPPTPTAVDLGGPARALGMGLGFACAVVGPDDHVACWGDGAWWTLGRADDTDSDQPIAVPGTADTARLDVGQRQVCATTSNGTTRCWGQNDRGQLATGSVADRLAPTTVPALAGYQRLALAGRFACGLDGGALRCWGQSDRGQLITDTGDRAVPGPVLAAGVREVATGSKSACAIDGTGQVACWGQNRAGELGLGDLAPRPTPTPVPGLTDAVALAAGYHHTCAEQAGALWCWGEDSSGQLGRGEAAVVTPARVTGATAGVQFAQVAAGDHTLCAVDRSGGLWCWGDNEWAQSGTGSLAGSSVPIRVLAVGVVEVALGPSHGCARDAIGVWCWGNNGLQQLGVIGLSVAKTPVRVITNQQVSAVATGLGHSCAIVAGVATCWGSNGFGQLGDGTTDDRATPTAVALPTGAAIALAVASRHSCAILDGGDLHCWGSNDRGQLGRDSGGLPLPGGNRVIHPDGLGWVDVAAGRIHGCAVDTDHELLCWGGNDSGQVGPAVGDQLSPVKVPLPGPADRVVARSDSTCAILSDGASLCWGNGEFGTGPGGAEPLPFFGLTDVVDFGGSLQEACAVRASGELRCAGLATRGAHGPDHLGWSPAQVPLACE